MDKELDKIPGMGRVLKDRIIRRCFNGNLESLTNARIYVHGIGEEKSFAIHRWVRDTRAKMPQLLHTNFPGKSQVLKKYAQLDHKTDVELRVNNSEHELANGTKSLRH